METNLVGKVVRYWDTFNNRRIENMICATVVAITFADGTFYIMLDNGKCGPVANFYGLKVHYGRKQ